MDKPKIAIIGYGRFGFLLKKILENDFETLVYDRQKKDGVTNCKGALSNCSSVIFATPIVNFEETVKEYAPFIKKGTTIIDVASVKEYTAKILKKYFSNDYFIIPTHPMFGPDSIKDKKGELQIVFCPLEKGDPLYFWENYFNEKGFKVVEMTLDEHDRVTAYSFCLVHYIGRALEELDIKTTGIDTKSYSLLLEIKRIISENSYELFVGIQKYNRFAKDMRKKLIKKLKEIDRKI